MNSKRQASIQYLIVYASSLAVLGYVLTNGMLSGMSELTHGTLGSTSGRLVTLPNEAGMALKLPPTSFGARLRSQLQEMLGRNASEAAEEEQVLGDARAGTISEEQQGISYLAGFPYAVSIIQTKAG